MPVSAVEKVINYKRNARDDLWHLVHSVAKSGGDIRFEGKEGYYGCVTVDDISRQSPNSLAEEKGELSFLERILIHLPLVVAKMPKEFFRSIIYVIKRLGVYVHVKRNGTEIIIYGSPDSSTRDFVIDILKEGRTEQSLHVGANDARRALQNLLR